MVAAKEGGKAGWGVKVILPALRQPQQLVAQLQQMMDKHHENNAYNLRWTLHIVAPKSRSGEKKMDVFHV